LSTQIQQILLSFQGQASSILFWIRPSTLGGSTDYGLAQLEENVELAQIISLTNDKGQNATSQNMPARISSEIFVNEFYPELFLINLIYLLPFLLQPRQSTHDGSDIGYLTMNGNNVSTLQTSAAAANGPYSLVVIEQDNLQLLESLLGKEMDITSLTFHPTLETYHQEHKILLKQLVEYLFFQLISLQTLYSS